MPNGVSCAYFAFLNHENGLKQDNVFREGVAVAQTTRTIDAIAASNTIASTPVLNSVLTPVRPVFSKLAAISRKIIYPLFILSSVFNTFKSNDKLKTGASQASGLVLMSTFETLEVKLLKLLEKKLPALSKISGNKYGKYLMYLLKGIMFITASMTGYTLGNKLGAKTVDKLRAVKQKNSNENIEKSNSELNTKEIAKELFSDMIIN